MIQTPTETPQALKKQNTKLTPEYEKMRVKSLGRARVMNYKAQKE